MDGKSDGWMGERMGEGIDGRMDKKRIGWMDE